MRRMDTFSYPSRTNSSLAASRISCRKYLFCRALRSFTPTLRAIPLTYLTSLIISHPLLLSSPSLGAADAFAGAVIALAGLQGFPGCCFRLSLHRNSHQFEVPSEQQRARSDEFPRRIVFACEVARVNGIELLKEGQVGTRNLHVHQVVHAHPRLRQHFLLSVQQRFNLIFYLLRHLAGLRINADAPCQIERVPGQDRVAKRRRNRPSGQFDYLPCWLRGHLRRHSAGGQNSSCEQRHRDKPHSTIHSFLLDTIVCDFLKSPTARRRECNTQSCLRQARPRSVDPSIRSIRVGALDNGECSSTCGFSAARGRPSGQGGRRRARLFWFYRRRRPRGGLPGGRRRSCARHRLLGRWIRRAVRGREEVFNDFARGRLADGAIAVTDAALRQRVLATAGARLCVELVKRDVSLLRLQLGQIDAGKLGGPVSVLQENLSRILKRFHFHIANRQTEQRPNFHFVENRIVQAFVFLHHAALCIEQE